MTTRMSARVIASLIVIAAAVPHTAAHAVSFEILGPGYATAMSADGSVIVGNTEGAFETFRWTETDGVVPLGRATVPVLGVGAGSPDVSDDGTRVSATILSDDGTLATIGRWTLGEGWEELGPYPVDGGVLDQSLGSAWGISGDGESVVGLYWRPGQPDGSAHPCAWTDAGGIVDLGTPGNSGRANAASFDGSVVAGWVEAPTGAWMPTLWDDGVRTVVEATDASCTLETVNGAGTIVGGQFYDEGTTLRMAAIWHRDGGGWTKEPLGVLPGTQVPFGQATALDMTADGSVVIGYNAYDRFDATGFIWTAGTGMLPIVEYLENHGVVLDGSFAIGGVSEISDDGLVIIGYGNDTAAPFSARFFRITTDGFVGVADAAVSPGVELHAAPNPTRGASTLSFELVEPGDVDLTIFDVRGRRVRALVSGSLGAGIHHASWDARDGQGGLVAPGVYYARVDVGGRITGEKLVVTR